MQSFSSEWGGQGSDMRSTFQKNVGFERVNFSKMILPSKPKFKLCSKGEYHKYFEPFLGSNDPFHPFFHHIFCPMDPMKERKNI